MSTKKIIRDGYTVEFEEPTLYVDNESRNRSGHMSHALAEFAPGTFIDFNSNCSAPLRIGHLPYGWIEYRISKDSGKSYSEVYELPYSKEAFYEGIYNISVEKAVGCDDGSIVAFCLRNTAFWAEPWDTPMVIRSNDGGKTWSEPTECIPYKGRIYDVRYRDGVIYVLIFCNEQFLGSSRERHKYRLYKSFDNGQTFEEASVIEFDTVGRGYGAMIFDSEGTLHTYAYSQRNESKIDHAISRDLGKSWAVVEPCTVNMGIRNPQIALIDGVYIMHGRSRYMKDFVFYTSTDATHWDEGTAVVEGAATGHYYSNNIKLRDEGGEFLLVQYSEAYYRACVNVKHIKLRIKKG